MSYKAFKGKWQAFGDKPIISILSTGFICLNKVCYDTYVKSSGYKYVKLYYNPEEKKIAFEFRSDRKGEFVLPVNLTKTGVLAVVHSKTFFNYFGIKYEGQSRSFPVHETIIRASGPGYQGTRKPVKGIEIKLTEYFPSGT